MASEEKFVKWLSAIFQEKELHERGYRTADPSLLYYDLTKAGSLKGVFKVSKLTQASTSRTRTKLIKKGFISEGIYSGKECLVSIHPDVAVNWACHENLSDKNKVLENFKDEISELNEGWQKNFKNIRDGKWIFPVHSWNDKVLYAQLMGWVKALNIKDATFRDPKLSELFTTIPTMFFDEFKKKDIDYTFKETVKPQPESYRKGVFSDGKRLILGYEVLGFPEIPKSSGAIFYKHEYINNLMA